jgi:hypothetical protein
MFHFLLTERSSDGSRTMSSGSPATNAIDPVFERALKRTMESSNRKGRRRFFPRFFCRRKETSGNSTDQEHASLFDDNTAQTGAVERAITPESRNDESDEILESLAPLPSWLESGSWASSREDKFEPPGCCTCSLREDLCGGQTDEDEENYSVVVPKSIDLSISQKSPKSGWLQNLMYKPQDLSDEIVSLASTLSASLYNEDDTLQDSSVRSLGGENGLGTISEGTSVTHAQYQGEDKYRLEPDLSNCVDDQSVPASYYRPVAVRRSRPSRAAVRKPATVKHRRIGRKIPQATYMDTEDWYELGSLSGI